MTTALLSLLVCLLPAAFCFPSEALTEAKSPWGDEFCRHTYCAVMSISRQDHCCAAYKQCCAYVDLRNNPGPFAYREPDEVKTLPPPTYKPKEIYVGPPKSMRLRNETKPPSRSLTLYHRRQRHYHTTTPQPRPAVVLLGEGEDIMKTSYNDQLVKHHERLCVPSYCSLMSSGQHKLCCNIFDECCAYSNYRRVFDPFHPDNGGRRR